MRYAGRRTPNSDTAATPAPKKCPPPPPRPRSIRELYEQAGRLPAQPAQPVAEPVDMRRPLVAEHASPMDALKMAPRDGQPLRPAALAGVRPRHRKHWR